MTRMPQEQLAPGRPRLVLVHGSRMGAAQWDGYADLLPGVEVVAVDLPGHGSRSGEEFTWEGAMATVRQSVEAAGDRPVVLAGHSLGGYVALAAAAEGTPLDGLVLVGATGEPRGVGALVYRGFARLALAVGPERTGRAASAVMRRLGAPAALADQLADGTGYDTLPRVWDAVMAHARAELLDRVRCPVTIVNGRYDQMRLQVGVFLRHAPHARVVVVPGATHLLPLTHPEALAAELRRAVDAARRAR